MGDDNMSVVSDVVTEDDIVIDPEKEELDGSRHSMSPEVAIEPQRISNSLHAVTEPQVFSENQQKNDDIMDFQQTLNVLGDFLSIDDKQKEEDKEKDTEHKTNSTKPEKKENEINIDTSWLFSDDDSLQNSENTKLPGMDVEVKWIKKAEMAPSHYIPA